MSLKNRYGLFFSKNLNKLSIKHQSYPKSTKIDGFEQKISNNPTHYFARPVTTKVSHREIIIIKSYEHHAYESVDEESLLLAKSKEPMQIVRLRCSYLSIIENVHIKCISFVAFELEKQKLIKFNVT